MILFDNNPLGINLKNNYIQKGLVLHLDAFKPRRDGSIPTETTKLWEDLTGNYDCTFTSAKKFTGKNGITFIDTAGVLDNSTFPKKGTYYAEFVATVSGGALIFRIYSNNYAGGVGISTNYAHVFNDKNNNEPWIKVKTGSAPKACYQCHSNGSLARINNRSFSFKSSPETWNTGHGTMIINSSATTSTVWVFRVYNRQLTSKEMEHNWRIDAKRFNLT